MKICQPVPVYHNLIFFCLSNQIIEGTLVQPVVPNRNRNRYGSSLLYEIGVNDTEPYIGGNVGDKQEQLFYAGSHVKKWP